MNKEDILLCEKVKELRVKSNMTQQKFADYFFIPKRTVENWEGKKSSPSKCVVNLIEYKLKNEKIIADEMKL